MQPQTQTDFKSNDLKDKDQFQNLQIQIPPSHQSHAFPRTSNDHQNQNQMSNVGPFRARLTRDNQNPWVGNDRGRRTHFNNSRYRYYNPRHNRFRQPKTEFLHHNLNHNPNQRRFTVPIYRPGPGPQSCWTGPAPTDMPFAPYIPYGHRNNSVYQAPMPMPMLDSTSAFYSDLLSSTYSSSGNGQEDEEYVPEPMYRIQLRQQLGHLGGSGSTGSASSGSNGSIGGSRRSSVSSSTSSSNNSFSDQHSSDGNSSGSCSGSDALSPTTPTLTLPKSPSAKTALSRGPLDSDNQQPNADVHVDPDHILDKKFLESEGAYVEAYVAVATRYVLVGKQRTERKTSFGVWAGDASALNFSEVMPELRPQCIKSVLIHGGARCVNALKERGFNKIKIIMESEFLVKNVADWTKKFLHDACNGVELTAGVSNWDEHKYLDEIKELCKSFQGMIVKWSYVSTKLEGIEKAKRLAHGILPLDYTAAE